MEVSQQELKLTHIQPHYQEPVTRQEVYRITRETIPASKSKKGGSRKKGYRTSTEGVEINETLKMAARGYGTNHRLDMESDALVQGILQKEGQKKKKGLFFFCC